ncbi:DUF2771 family protein [Modestobacter sp. NPDC049651]|uniref:DUF2771 family protein n=1 Tax=unclassified Modestobacter TaxID=2643866 RepID=UPI0033F9F47D
MNTAVRAGTGVLLLAGLTTLAGCGDGGGSGESRAPLVGVAVAGQEISIEPTQYCLNGDGRRYSVSPPVLEVTPDQDVRLRVPDAVADRGWAVQVWDEGLEQKLGDVEVDRGTQVYDEITTSDVVPATFYLVVVEDTDKERCSGLSGAWPVGFIRTAGGAAASTSAPASSSAPATP